MSATKIYDLAVKTSSYTDRASGTEKNRYQNVGSILQMDDGSKMILLNRFFNPAGVPFKDGSDQIIVSMFKPKDREDGGSMSGPAPAFAPAPTAAPRPAMDNNFDDSIPF